MVTVAVIVIVIRIIIIILGVQGLRFRVWRSLMLRGLTCRAGLQGAGDVFTQEAVESYFKCGALDKNLAEHAAQHLILCMPLK